VMWILELKEQIRIWFIITGHRHYFHCRILNRTHCRN